MKDIHIREHLLKSGKKSYEYRFEGAMVNGKRKWITKSGFKTKIEAKRAGILAQQQYENLGQVISPSDISFADYLDLWIEKDCEIDLKPSTISGYKKKIENHIKPAFGAYRIKAIKREDLQAFVVDMYDKGYSKNTLSVIVGILSKCFNYAVDHKYLLYSPAVRIKIPKNRTPKTPTRKVERAYISKEIMKSIFERFPEHSTSYMPLRIGYECGLRIGEVFALVWEDIDLENKTITVNRQIQWQEDKVRTARDKLMSNGSSDCGNGYWYFTNPKYNSFRVVEISDSLVELLQREKERQENMRAHYKEYYKLYYSERPLYFGDKTTENTVMENPINDLNGNLIKFVCVRENGTYISSRTMQHTSSVVRKSIYDKFSFHALRHTHASMLYEAGLSEKYISERLGHKNGKTTRDVYVHLTESLNEQGRTAINKIFGASNNI